MKAERMAKGRSAVNEDFLPARALDRWPPPDDYPVVVGPDGTVYSLFSHHKYDLSIYAGKNCTIGFGESGLKRGASRISPGNARLFRVVVCWFMFGDRPRIKPSTVAGYAKVLKPIFVLCSRENILASELSHSPKVRAQLSTSLLASQSKVAVQLLHELLLAKDTLGFQILDEIGIAHLVEQFPSHNTQQTPYVPPRIFLYALDRMQVFLSDVATHIEKIEKLYRYSVDKYVEAYGTPEALFAVPRKKLNPFTARLIAAGRASGRFLDVLEEFGLRDLHERWVSKGGAPLASNTDVLKFQSLLTQITFVAVRYIECYSGMRIGEVRDLRSDCLEIEIDEKFGKIYLLVGETTKTIEDSDARWVSSPEVELAVDLLRRIARLNVYSGNINPSAGLAANDEKNPPFLFRSFSPWAQRPKHNRRATGTRIDTASFGMWPRLAPNLFDPAALRITEKDIVIARAITPTLPDQYEVGMIWPLRDHQIRRTVAVNMGASGLVSDPSLQYQLKHLVRAQSLYYKQNFSKLVLNGEYKRELLDEHYRDIVRKFTELHGVRYVSPHGGKHKENLLKLIADRDATRLEQLAKKGRMPMRSTLFGMCMNDVPVPMAVSTTRMNVPTARRRCWTENVFPR